MLQRATTMFSRFVGPARCGGVTRADVVKRIEQEGVVAIVRIPDAKLGREWRTRYWLAASARSRSR